MRFRLTPAAGLDIQSAGNALSLRSDNGLLHIIALFPESFLYLEKFLNLNKI